MADDFRAKTRNASCVMQKKLRDCSCSFILSSWVSIACTALNGVAVPARPNIGIYTQPISFIGLPVVSVPVWLPGARLPIGVQVIAPAWREDIALRIAAHLEATGAVRAPVAEGMPA